MLSFSFFVFLGEFLYLCPFFAQLERQRRRQKCQQFKQSVDYCSPSRNLLGTKYYCPPPTPSSHLFKEKRNAISRTKMLQKRRFPSSVAEPRRSEYVKSREHFHVDYHPKTSLETTLMVRDLSASFLLLCLISFSSSSAATSSFSSSSESSFSPSPSSFSRLRPCLVPGCAVGRAGSPNGRWGKDERERREGTGGKDWEGGGREGDQGAGGREWALDRPVTPPP